MSSPAKHLRDALVAALVSTDATTFYGAEAPPFPDELTNVRDTPGLAPQDFLGSSAAVETCGVQVLVRATSEVAGIARAWAAYDYLRGLNAVTLGGVSYLAVLAISPPFALGPDDTGVTLQGSEGRRLWSLNFVAQRQR